MRILTLLLLISGIATQTFAKTISVNSELAPFIQSFNCQEIGKVTPKVDIILLKSGIYKVDILYKLKTETTQSDCRFSIQSAFKPIRYWSSQLSPKEGSVVDQSSFKSPMMFVNDDKNILTIIPDLSALKNQENIHWYMDMNAVGNSMDLGLASTLVKNGLHYTKEQTTYPAGELSFSFYIIASTKKTYLENPWRLPLSMLWKDNGESAYKLAKEEDKTDYIKYIHHSYDLLTKRWKDKLWVQNEKGSGIINSIDITGNVIDKSVHFTAYNNALKTASGLYKYAVQNKLDELKAIAISTKNMALAFPQKNGLFKTIYDQGAYGNSPINPINRDIKMAPYHILDMSAQADQMLLWYTETERDEKLLDYAKNYANTLLKLQIDTTYFPSFVDEDGSAIKSNFYPAESAKSASFLVQLYTLTKNEDYLNTALEVLKMIEVDLAKRNEWKTAYAENSTKQIGLTQVYSDRNKQSVNDINAILWVAEAYYRLYMINNEAQYSEKGRVYLDEALTYVSTFNYPFSELNTLGSFGSTNIDINHFSSEQITFSELLLNYGTIFTSDEYTLKGLSALRNIFQLMYSPENTKTKALWEKTGIHPIGYGFMNTSISDLTPVFKSVSSINTDCGNAAENYLRVRRHQGDDFLKIK